MVMVDRMMSHPKMCWDYMKQMPKQRGRRRVERKTIIEDEMDMPGKIVLVTGANSGLGKQSVLELGLRGARVVMACRNIDKGEEARVEILKIVPTAHLLSRTLNRCSEEEEEVMKLDLGDLSSIRQFAHLFKGKYPHVNILIENGGLSVKKMSLTQDGFETNMGVNYLGHFLLTLLLLDHLKKGAPSRILCISDTMMQTGKLNLLDLMMLGKYGTGDWVGSRLYSNSKLAQALFVKQLGNRLDGSGISSFGLCPGLVRTKVSRNDPWYLRGLTKVAGRLAGFNVRKGCQTIIYCAMSKKLDKETGKMYRFMGPWKKADRKLDRLQTIGKQLWVKSLQLVQVPDWSRSSQLLLDTSDDHRDHDGGQNDGNNDQQDEIIFEDLLA